MFIFQGLPAALLGIVVLMRLDDKPATARWLTAPERMQLQRAVGEPADHAVPWRQELKMTFAHTGIGWPVAAGFFLIAAAAIFGLWGPQLLQDILATDVKGIGATFGLYFLLGTVAMLTVGSLADHTGRREAILVALLATGALGFFAAAAFAGQATMATIAMGGGVIAYLASFPVFWGSVTPRLAPAAAAAAIALINSLANLGGAVGTAVMGPIKQELGLAAAIAVPGVCLALSAVFALMIKRRLSAR